MPRTRFILILAAALTACRPEASPVPESSPEPASRPVLLMLGDSLTAGYGVAADEAYPALLQARHPELEIRNAGVSGATSTGILENLDWNLTPEVKFVFLAIGANDGLRGLDLSETEKNIDAILAACARKNASAALAGMKIPPNYGTDYAARFAAMYPAAARRHGVPLMPFLLDGVAGIPAMNIEDGIHPNSEGHRRIADAAERFLKEVGWLR
ncbi:MAG: hypothetical protein AUJ52_14180 [Elusimicrobia bacterium CG1_02_63_36]|nr:MAG: hypothetical protein AUJ52_14180 [Elusimicrobia bacterium CG1_02_63_36]PIP82610.1 MAG: arylesterase [Elusimicrobia bacterium CG22_combo_CG10-13_8_21_14_all_63_91]PJA17799.1 MAG: arylesterase [Elusimicrobia bacterium CG_4_10_14_0_2_um_filter_63_34]PJB24266.1 MAG: arylesterase [Elusimicrobia bacterium CG_4_9_14_3_um_filter_62_55]